MSCRTAGTARSHSNRILNSAHYLRLRTQYNTDFDGIAKSWSTTAEWQPVSNELGLSAPSDSAVFDWEFDQS